MCLTVRFPCYFKQVKYQGGVDKDPSWKRIFKKVSVAEILGNDEVPKRGAKN